MRQNGSRVRQRATALVSLPKKMRRDARFSQDRAACQSRSLGLLWGGALEARTQNVHLTARQECSAALSKTVIRVAGRRKRKIKLSLPVVAEA